jgi:asparagine N-glycosylation enzyme membrane subunit Stt3
MRSPTRRSARLQGEILNVFHRSDSLFLTAAFLSFLFSVYLWFTGQRDEGMFVGIWVPSILSFATLAALARKR